MGAAGSSTRAIHNHHPGSGRSNGSTNLKGRGSFSKDQTFYTPNPNNQFIQHYHQQLSNSYDRKHNLTSSNRSRGYSQNHSCTRSQQHLQIPSSFPATSTTKPLQYSTSSPSSGNPLTQHPQHHASSLSLQKTFGRRRSSNQTMESLSPSSHGSIFSTTPNSSIHHDHLPRHSEEHPDDLISGQEFRWLHGRRYHNTPSLYMLPNDTEEVDRLHLQHYVFKMIQGGKNIHVPIPENGRVIDLGCGPATWTMDMATDMSTVNFVGIDISPIFPTAIHPRNCSFFCENILTGLAKSQPDGCYDVVFQRNVSAGFTAQDWQTAVREAYRLCKPGGWFESVESDASVHDAGPKTTLLFDFMLRSMGARLVDPTAVRTLSQMMIEAGFVDVQVKEYSVPLGEWGGKLGQLWKQNIGAILETVTPHLAKAASKPDSHIREMVKDMMQNETKEHRAYQTIYVAFGRKPSSE